MSESRYLVASASDGVFGSICSCAQNASHPSRSREYASRVCGDFFAAITWRAAVLKSTWDAGRTTRAPEALVDLSIFVFILSCSALRDDAFTKHQALHSSWVNVSKSARHSSPRSHSPSSLRSSTANG